MVRHDLSGPIAERELTDSGYASQNLLSYGIHVADLNGDGFGDMIAGKPGASPNGLFEAGEVVVWWGPDLLSKSTYLSLVPSQGAWFGSWVRTGDVTGDGVTDLLVGAREETVAGISNAGAAYVLVGPNFTNKIRVTSLSPEQGARFGHEVAHTDWNGDGIQDLVVSSPKASSGGFVQAGQVSIFIAPNFSSRLTIECPNPAFGTKFGYTIEGADFDNDGMGDLAIGAPFHGVNPGDQTGAGYLYKAPSLLPWVSHLQPAGYALLGNAVTTGDFNGDGNIDVAFGAEFDSQSGVVEAGSVHILLGPTFQNPFEIVSPMPTVQGGFGGDVCAADVNNDGYSDLVVGEFWYTVPGFLHTGRGFVCYGPSFEQMTELRPLTVDAGASRGRRVASGDINGDGFAEAVLGAPFATPGSNANLNDGSLHIFYY
jgi:hypothetical protein